MNGIVLKSKHSAESLDSKNMRKQLEYLSKIQNWNILMLGKGPYSEDQ